MQLFFFQDVWTVNQPDQIFLQCYLQGQDYPYRYFRWTKATVLVNEINNIECATHHDDTSKIYKQFETAVYIKQIDLINDLKIRS